MLYMKVKRVSPKSFHHKEKNYFFYFVSTWDNGRSLNLLWSSFHDYVSQISMLYVLNLFSAVYQLYLEKYIRYIF